MKQQQSIVDIIVYLLEAVISQQMEVVPEPAIVKQKLEEAGFAKETIIRTFDWLKELIEQQCWYAEFSQVDTSRTLRVFSSEEAYKITLEIRSFILSLEHVGILDTKMREIVISQLMQLNQRLISLNDAKWVVFLVLMSKANKNAQEMRSFLLTTMARKT
ncbi:Protein Smg homolog [Gammaproteobacteria bacterium]